jgi:hypothetical protein
MLTTLTLPLDARLAAEVCTPRMIQLNVLIARQATSARALLAELTQPASREIMATSVQRVTIAHLEATMRLHAQSVPTLRNQVPETNLSAFHARLTGTMTCQDKVAARNVVQLHTPMVAQPLALALVLIVISLRVPVPASAPLVSSQRTTLQTLTLSMIASKSSLRCALLTNKSA